MKKIIRLLGVTLVLVSLNSCSKDDVPSDGAIELTQKNLEGTYKIEKLTVPVAVDVDNDGKTNTNLLLETGKSCVWDNNWEFGGPSMFIKEAGIKCDPNGSAIILDESITIDIPNKIIKFDSGSTQSYNNVQISMVSGVKKISFETLDTSLSQTKSFVLSKI